VRGRRRPGPAASVDRRWPYFLAFSFSRRAVGRCVLLRWTLPHSSTRSQTLWGGTASLHCGQIFNAGATRKSWLLRIPCRDGDLRLFGTATTAHSQSKPVALILREKSYYPNPRSQFKSDFPGSLIVLGRPLDPDSREIPGGTPTRAIPVPGTRSRLEVSPLEAGADRDADGRTANPPVVPDRLIRNFAVFPNNPVFQEARPNLPVGTVAINREAQPPGPHSGCGRNRIYHKGLRRYAPVDKRLNHAG
jgi:hypothetical protein